MQGTMLFYLEYDFIIAKCRQLDQCKDYFEIIPSKLRFHLVIAQQKEVTQLHWKSFVFDI
jgi:hypothetical protein